MSTTQWFYSYDGTQHGPVALAALSDMLARAQISRQTLVWHAGMAGWQAACDAEELRGALASAPATTPPPLPASSLPYALPRQNYPDQNRGSEIGQDAGIRMLIPVGRSGWAIAAGYCGLLSFFPLIGILTGILGIVFGLLAIKDIKANPKRHGLGRAYFGIIAGAIFIVVWALVFGYAMAR